MKAHAGLRSDEFHLVLNVLDDLRGHHHSTTFHNLDETVASFRRDIPSFDETFGHLGVGAVGPNDSIFSPAAYFVDLMRLVSTHLSHPQPSLSFQRRRPDLSALLLGAESTVTEVPYLQIVNDVLCTRLGGPLYHPDDVDDREVALRHIARHPELSSHLGALPYNTPLAEVRSYLVALGIDLASVYQGLAVGEGPVARERMELSIEELDLITHPRLAPDGKPVLTGEQTFLGLAAKLGWNTADLTVAMSAFGGGFNSVTVRQLESVQWLMHRFDLPVDVVCSFHADMMQMSWGIPTSDLFVRTFGRDCDGLTGLLPPAGSEGRNWLCTSLQVTDAELSALIAALATRSSPGLAELSMTLRNLTRLYRLRTLSTILRLSVADTLLLLTMLGWFDRVAGTQRDAHGSLEQVVALVEYVDWLGQARISVPQLCYLVTGEIVVGVDIRGLDTDAVAVMLGALSVTIAHVEPSERRAQVLATWASFLRTDVGLLGGVYALAYDANEQAEHLAAIDRGAAFDLDAMVAVVAVLARLLATVRALSLTTADVDNMLAHEGRYGLSLPSTNWPTANSLQLVHQVKTGGLPFGGNDHALGLLHAIVLDNAVQVAGRALARAEFRYQDALSSGRDADVVVINEPAADVEARQTAFRHTLATRDAAVQALDAALKPHVDSIEQATSAPQAEVVRLHVVNWFRRTDYWPWQTGRWAQVLVAIQRTFGLCTVAGVELDVLLSLGDLATLPSVAVGDINHRWQPAQDEAWKVYYRCSADLAAIVTARFSGELATRVIAPMQDRRREQQRSALAVSLMNRLNTDATVTAEFATFSTLDQLSKYLLVDVEMGSCTTISPVREGLNALQMYVHRCRSGLETNVHGEIPDAHWAWMSHYRVWEANRRVFLYPENFLDPTLRARRTPLFQALQGELLQGDLSGGSIRTAYTSYVESLEQLSRLDIVGSYFCPVERAAHPEFRYLFSMGGAAAPDLNLGRIPAMLRDGFTTSGRALSELASVQQPPIEPNENWVVHDGAIEYRLRRHAQHIKVHQRMIAETTNTLFIVGRTNTHPQTHFVRTAEMNLYAATPHVVRWMPWERIDLAINAEAVSPIFAFGKLFVFWIEPRIERRTKSGPSVVVGSKEVLSRASLKFAFRNVNGRWSSPQPVDLLTDHVFERIDGDAAGPKSAADDWKSVHVVRLPPMGGEPERILVGYGPFGDEVDPFSVRLTLTADFDERLTTLDTRSPLSFVSVACVVGNDSLKLAALGTSFPDNAVRPAKTTSTDANKPPEILRALTSTARIIPVRNQPEWQILDVGDEAYLVMRLGTRAAFVSENLSFVGQSPTLPVVSYNPGPTAQGEVWLNRPVVFVRIGTTVARQLGRTLSHGGLDELLTPKSQKRHEPLFNRFAPNDARVIGPKEHDSLDFRGPYGEYFWEVFFHAPFLIAAALNTQGRFEEAQHWFERIFHPTSPPEPDGHSRDHRADRCWRFRPFRRPSTSSLHDMLTDPHSVGVFEDDPFDADGIARLRIGAYERAVVMRYIDNLLDWADALFAKDTWEDTSQAALLYIRVADLLGPRPAKTTEATVNSQRSFATLEADGTAIVAGLRQGNLVAKLRPRVQTATVADPTPSKYMPFQLGDLLHFGVPDNERFVAYWDQVEDRLFKLRHCMNVKGDVRHRALFDPPVDPMQLVRSVASGAGMPGDGFSFGQPGPSIYRFSVLLAQAKAITMSLCQLGGGLLAALEKNDSGQLTRLRTVHERSILALTTDVKQRQVDEAVQGLAHGQLSLRAARERRAHYQGLVDASLSAAEQLSVAKMDAALSKMKAAHDWRVAAIVANLVPTVFGLADGGFQPGPSISEAAGLLDAEAGIENHRGAMAVTAGQNARRLDEWQLNVTLADHDIEQLSQQLTSATIGQAIAEKMLDIHNATVTQSDQLEDYFSNRFGTEELYQWMIGRLRTIYNDTYQLAMQQALSAQRAFRFERSRPAATFINASYSDGLHSRLLAGEELMAALEHLEVAYRADDIRDFEIEKTISLAQLGGGALDDLRRDGTGRFNLSEQMFDRDFPGHFCRKIASMAISIPAVVGPYQNIQARLVQNVNYLVLAPDVNAIAGLLPGGDIYAVDPAHYEVDTRVTQVVISKGINDAGVFELNFRDEKYGPFEGTGAVSDWTLEIPKAANHFDFNSISDVIVHLRYTARDGGEDLRNRVVELPAVKTCSGARTLSVRQEFAPAWRAATVAFETARANSSDATPEFAVTFPVTADLFPRNLRMIVPTEPTQLDVVARGTTDPLRVAVSTDDGGFGLGEWTITIQPDPGQSPTIDDIVLTIPFDAKLPWKPDLLHY